MARYVNEIMNREVLSLPPETAASDAVGTIRAFGVTGVPVLDEHQRPVGMLTMRDLVGDLGTDTVSDRMTRTVVTVEAAAPIESAARILCERSLHRLPAVDREGRVVGMVSSLDVLRGMVGLPTSHPAQFPHFDERTGLIWSDDIEFEVERVLKAAADGPGLFVLVRGGPGRVEQPVWAESAGNVRSRLVELATSPQPSPIAQLLSRGHLRFKTAAEPDPARRETALHALRASMWS